MRTRLVLVPMLLWTAPVLALEPNEAEIGARVFEEPLVPIGGRSSMAENKELRRALAAHLKRTDRDDTSAITRFLQQHPNSQWRVSLLANLGLAYRRSGHFSKALDAWNEAWRVGKDETDLKARAVVDRAVGERADLTARLGHDQLLESLLEELKERDVRGPATERLALARQALWQMQHQPEESFRCGPYALSRANEANRSGNALTAKILETRVTSQGMSLQQLGMLADRFKMKYRIAKREPGAPIPVPAVVHWKVGHYGALVREQNQRYLLQDPTLNATGGSDGWISLSALDSEASGYFLIPEGPLPGGWRSVSQREAEGVVGRGYTNASNPNGNGPNDPRGGGGGCGPGMASYSVHLMLVSLYIEDMPVGYAPPRGPDMHFKIAYSQREANQPAMFSYSNFGPKWTFDWLSYVIDDPQNPLANADVYNRGGGTETHVGFDPSNQSYAPQYLNGAVLRRTSPTSYERRMPDGSIEVFSRSDGATSFPRKVFMTQIADPFGNAVTLNYDASLRLVSATDPLGQATTLSYELPSDSLKITRVTDPFGRQATFEYNPNGQLIRITDVIGLTSQFEYDPGDFVRSLTTPYGTTTFAKGEQGTTRFLEARDPLGDTERVEYRHMAPGIRYSEVDSVVPSLPEPDRRLIENAYLDARNTFYWDKKVWRDFPGDYTKARIFHWLHDNDATTGRVLESVKAPLENRIWFIYPGQTTPRYLAGTRIAQPSRIARVLDDGSTQLYQFEYNRRGRVTRAIDPTGRQLSSNYSFNGVDLLEVAQTGDPNPELLASLTYNHQHLPLTATDAAQQATAFTYNGFGQVLTITNPKNETKRFSYDDNGYLLRSDGPVPGSTTSFSYDAFGRKRTVTDSEGYTITLDYDPLNRLTRVTYPDGTSRQIVYNRLDPEQLIDRLGHTTVRRYNALRQLISSEDPLHQITQFEWCRCGALEAIIDPLNQRTSWTYDVQRRVVSKVFPDRSQTLFTYENTTSRLQEISDAKGQTKQYQYFIDNNLRQIGYLGGPVPTPSVSFTYDPRYNRILTIEDGTGRTTYTYYPITKSAGPGAGQLATETGSLPNSTISYEYDELGRVLRRAINGVVQSSAYDALGRVTRVMNPLGGFAFSYVNQTRRLSAIDYPNGQRTTFSYYDNLGDQRLQEIQNLDPTSAVLSRFNYTYDSEGRVGNWTKQWDGGSPTVYAFGYDDADQLLSATPQGFGASRFLYAYDDARNRITEQIDDAVTTASYNNLNELVGRQVSTLPDPDPVVRRSEVTYDGLGRRVRIVERQNDAVVSDRRFLWCGAELCEERDASGAVVVKRFYRQGMQFNGNNYFYTRDHLRSVREMTDVTGAVRARYDYDPYGRRTKLSGDLDADFGFTDHYFHATSGLHLTLHRGYDANLGRWVSRDPIGERGGFNLYVYVENNPVNLVDPTGQFSLIPPLQCGLCQPPPADGPLHCDLCKLPPPDAGGSSSGSSPFGPPSSGSSRGSCPQGKPPDDPFGPFSGFGSGSGAGGDSGSGSGGSGGSGIPMANPEAAKQAADPDPPKGETPSAKNAFTVTAYTDPLGFGGVGGKAGPVGPVDTTGFDIPAALDRVIHFLNDIQSQ